MSEIIPISVTDQVTARIKQSILSGGIGAGERLPSERELAVSLGVSRLSLRSAIARLSALNLLSAQQGGGTVVLDFRNSGGVELIPDLLEYGGDPDAAYQLVSDLLQLRRAVAHEAVIQAIEKAQPADLLRLETEISLQHQAGRSLSDQVITDLDIVQTILNISGNLAMELVFNTIRRVCMTYIDTFCLLHQAFEERNAVYALLMQLFKDKNIDDASVLVRRGLVELDKATMLLFKDHFSKLETNPEIKPFADDWLKAKSAK